MVRPKDQSQQCAAPSCGRPVPRKDRRRRGPNNKYCGPRCRQRAYRSRNATPRISRFSTHDTGGVTNCGKIINDLNEVQASKSRPSLAERAPSVTLLGGGPRTPWTGYKLDRKTWEAILYAEVARLGQRE